MSEFDVKMQLLDLSGGDVEKAKLMFGWLNEATPSAEPAPVEGGIVLTEKEVLGCEAEDLRAIAMKRLAAKQNEPADAWRIQGVLSTGGL